MMKIAILALGGAGVAIALLDLLKPWGDAQWGPGYGDVLNGGAGLGLMVGAGLLGVVALARKRRAESGGSKA